MFSTVDTLTPISKHFEMSDKSLYLLRPNGSDYVEIKKNAHLGIENYTKALVAFVEDNFPQFKLMPIDERADFAKFIINDDLRNLFNFREFSKKIFTTYVFTKY